MRSDKCAFGAAIASMIWVLERFELQGAINMIVSHATASGNAIRTQKAVAGEGDADKMKAAPLLGAGRREEARCEALTQKVSPKQRATTKTVFPAARDERACTWGESMFLS